MKTKTLFLKVCRYLLASLLLSVAFMITGLQAQNYEWKWVKGDKGINQSGIYGTPGTATSTNKPGGRYGGYAWIDANGNFWQFGGAAYDVNGNSGFLNDLWKYTPSTNQWTWMSGSSTNDAAGVYGTKGTAAAANIPGSRYAAAAAMDASGNFWIFGGGYGTSISTVSSYYNDLWKYMPSTGMWTWVGGTSSANQYGTYGTNGSASTANYPGGRIGALNWTNASGGDIWLLGGVGYSAASVGYMNDLWSYNTAAGTWTWMSGDNTISNDGVYGTLGTPAAANTPGSRYSGAITWIDASGNLWLFGGKGFPATGTTAGYLDDLWEYVDVTVLAVNWLDFTGVPAGNHALLQWQTTEEENNWYFTVERSADGQNWQNIGTVPGAGSSTATNTYEFTDNQPLAGVNYYRLQLNDATGEAQYSKIINVNLLTARNQVLSWYATGSGAVQATLSNGSNEVFRLFDMRGRLLKQGSLQNGQVIFSGLVPGLYVLQVNATMGLMTEKMDVP